MYERYDRYIAKLHHEPIVDLFRRNSPKDILGLLTPYEDLSGTPGIRSDQELNKRYDLVYAGCSETYGEYLAQIKQPKEYTKYIWGELVSQELSTDSVNLSVGGGSVHRIVSVLVNYFSTYGNPKICLLYLPDLYRISIPNDPRTLIDYQGRDDILPTPDQISFIEDRKPKISKRPHGRRDVLPMALPVWMNLQALGFFEQYCSMSNIELLYSTWAVDTEYSLLALNELSLDSGYEKPFKSFIETDAKEWLSYTGGDRCSLEIQNCHKDLEKQDPSLFRAGSDGTHKGRHQHQHIAEIFLNRLTNN